MSFKSCIRIFPSFSKHFNYGKILLQSKISISKPTIYHFTQNVRHLVNDASKTEIPDGRERVYYGVLTPQIRAVKWFSLTTSAAGIIAQPFIYNELAAVQSISLVLAACSFVGFFTFVTPLMLHYITKKYVTHLDYKRDTKSYIASTVNFFCMLKETEFTTNDVKIPDIPGMFTTFEVKGAGFFLDPRLFTDPGHYSQIMGYDKPIDFKLYEDTAANEKQK